MMTISRLIGEGQLATIGGSVTYINDTVAVAAPAGRRGRGPGQLGDDFDVPLPDSELDAWEGVGE
jgi:hypothetical protein